MKNSLLLLSIISLSCIFTACSKSSGNGSGTQSLSSFYLTANDTLVIYTVNAASIEDVNDLHTTLITGQYPDTSSKQGSLGIRVIGDTTGRYSGDSLMVTYVNSRGDTYYNTKDSSNYVIIDQYEKKYNGIVSGRFAMTVSNGTSSVTFTNGSFKALYQE